MGAWRYGKTVNQNITFPRPLYGGGTLTESRDYTVINGFRQSAPIDRTLAYTMQRGTMTHWNGPAGSEDQANYGFWSIYPIPNVSWYNQLAYEKMRAKAFDSVELGQNLAEYREAHKLFSGTASTLVGVARDLRKGDLISVARRLKLTSVPYRKRVSLRSPRLDGYYGASRQIAANWLMFAFGVEPLVKDLWAASEVFEQPLKALRLKGRAKSGIAVIKPSATNFSNMYYVGGQPQTQVMSKVILGTYRTEVGCEVRLNNPHLLFLEQSGLINPASIAWELVPFSFVADWLGNFGSVIRRMSDFAGLDVQMKYMSSKWQYVSEFKEVHNGLARTSSAYTRVHSVRFVRSEAWPAASFTLKPLALPSARRIATAAALIVQLLPAKGLPRR